MTSFHPAIKILTATAFIVLMSGFVAFKSGAFDGSRSAQLKLNVSITGVSYHRKAERELPSKRTVHEGREPVITKISNVNSWMSSSKTIGTAISLSDYSGVFGSPYYTTMSSSKYSVLADEAELFSVYQGIFSMPYGWKAKSKGAQLKQGKR